MRDEITPEQLLQNALAQGEITPYEYMEIIERWESLDKRKNSDKLSKLDEYLRDRDKDKE